MEHPGRKNEDGVAHVVPLSKQAVVVNRPWFEAPPVACWSKESELWKGKLQLVVLGQGRNANEMEMNTSTPRVSYVFENESNLGGKEHEAAYVAALVQVLASIRVLLDSPATVQLKQDFLGAGDSSERASEFARSIYWDGKDAVRLPLIGTDLELLCNADPIAFALLSRGERFP